MGCSDKTAIATANDLGAIVYVEVTDQEVMNELSQYPPARCASGISLLIDHTRKDIASQKLRSHYREANPTPLIYVAGAYRARLWKPAWTMTVFYPLWRVYKFIVEANNIRKARKASLKLWKTGLWAVICPHSNTGFFPDHAADWLKGDLEMLKRCEAIYMLKGWRESEGAKKEWMLAVAMGIKVIYEYELDDPRRYTTVTMEKKES